MTNFRNESGEGHHYWFYRHKIVCQFYANKFDNIHELDTFLERHKLLPFISY